MLSFAQEGLTMRYLLIACLLASGCLPSGLEAAQKVIDAPPPSPSAQTSRQVVVNFVERSAVTSGMPAGVASCIGARASSTLSDADMARIHTLLIQGATVGSIPELMKAYDYCTAR